MKKYFSMVLMGLVTVLFAACGDEPNPIVETDPFEIQVQKDGQFVKATDGMTITVSDFNEMTGQLSFDGKIVKLIDDDFTLDVDVERIIVDGATDELCLSQCVPGNGEATQTFSDNISKTETEFYAHLTPANAVIYTINYFFHKQGDSKGITIHVEYDATSIPQ
ncbi:MAG: hypothetical protein Q4D14_04655 [Bacteroidales bacterium]|nr:hypothetical protein [Bacteroidales bacterium]